MTFQFPITPIIKQLQSQPTKYLKVHRLKSKESHEEVEQKSKSAELEMMWKIYGFIMVHNNLHRFDPFGYFQ